MIDRPDYVSRIMSDPSQVNGRETNDLLNTMYDGHAVEFLGDLLHHEDSRVHSAGRFILSELDPSQYPQIAHLWDEALFASDPELQHAAAKAIYDHTVRNPKYLEGMIKLRGSQFEFLRTIAEDWIADYRTASD